MIKTTQNIQKSIARNILLNPGPATTSVAVKEAMVVSDICPREKEFASVLRSVLTLSKKVVSQNDDHYQTVLIPGSGTGAIEAVLTSVVAEDEGLLIIDNGAYGDRMAKIANCFGLRHHVLKTTWGDPLNYTEIEKFLAENATRFKYLAFIHHETTSGILNDLKKLSSLAEKYKLQTIVDAMSSYAGIEINLDRTPVNYLISSSNKCIQGMAGIGIVIADSSSLEALKAKKARNFYFNLYQNYDSQTHKGQFLFTPPVQILYALDTALKEFFAEGRTKRAQRYSDLYEQMYAGMLELGFKPLATKEHHSKILTAFIEPDHANYHFDKMHDYLYERGVTIYPGKGAREETFRISNIGELASSDISYFLTLMRDFLKEQKINLLE